ncbi:MAG TPA: GAF domain-containing protein, partial [Elusimicrobiales bacterium]|nr:GAF domain-containing protein [Elusimicrobiales bacterium]
MIVQTQESLEMLVMVSRLLSSKLDISELLTTIMRLASRVVGAERASLYLLDEKTQELYFDVALGLPAEVAKMRLKLGEGVAGVCAKEGRSIISNDVAGDNRHAGKVDARSGFVTRSLLT